MRALLSLEWASRVTRPPDSSRSTAVVIAPLVSSTRRPISFTGCGPLWRSISMIAKSERPTCDDSMLRVASRSSVRCAFISTNHRCVPERSAACFLGGVRFMGRYLNMKILCVKVYAWNWTAIAGVPAGSKLQPPEPQCPIEVFANCSTRPHTDVRDIQADKKAWKLDRAWGDSAPVYG